MLKASTCLDPAALESLLHGRLSDSQCEEAEAHLLSCNACFEALILREPTDALVETLRRSRNLTEDTHSSLVHKLTAEICRLKPVSREHSSREGIQATCPRCARTFPVESESGGANVECPNCKLELNAPWSVSSGTVHLDYVPLGLFTQAHAAGLPVFGDNATPAIPEKIGPYRVLKELGAGGMGAVYLAEDTLLHRKVALKTMLPKFAAKPAAKDRFLREARAAAAIEHEHVITIHQVGEERGVPFLAMPLLQGVPLDRYLKEQVGADGAVVNLVENDGRACLANKEICRIGRQIALGLSAAHARGLVHRDIKPANIWLEGEERKVKILDFGLARSEEDDTHLTQTGDILGTPAYMAPEQARSETVDARADLFSLGVILYEMATGRRPFFGRDTMSLLTALALDTPEPPALINTKIPAELSNLILCLLDKDPAKRPATARDVADRLLAIEDPLSATPPRVVPAVELPRQAVPTSAASSLWSRRRSFLAATLVGVPLLILLVAGVVLRFSTENGTLVVEVDGDADIRFQKGELRIHGEEGKVKYALKPSDKNKILPPGKYLIEIVGADGLKLSTDRFEIAQAGKAKIRVSVETPQVAEKTPTPKGDPPAKKMEPETPVVVPVEKPFVLLRDGKVIDAFRTFAGLIPSLLDRDVIEVRSDGPFELGPLHMKGKTLTLQAGAGFRPRFLPHASVFKDQHVWLKSTDGDLTLDGCDFIARPKSALKPYELVTFLQGENSKITIRNGRVLGFTGFGTVTGKSLHVEDSLLVTGYMPGLFVKTDCTFQNCIVYTSFPITLAGSGEQRITLRNNTICSCGDHHLGVVHLEKETKDVSILAEGNVFDFAYNRSGFNTPLSGIDWQKRVAWTGRNNLYRGLANVGAGGKQSKGLDGWAKLTGKAEEGSRETSEQLDYAFEKSIALNLKDSLQSLSASLDEMRKQSGISDLGPDYDLIGPGEAYVKALAAAGKPVPAHLLRPEAEVGGPCVLLRAAKVVGGFAKLQEAVQQARDGDVVEIRSDGVFPDGCSFPADRGTITLRAAPGYRPTIAKEGVVADLPGTRLILEGIHFQAALLRVMPFDKLNSTKKWDAKREPRILRIANCSFDWPRNAVPNARSVYGQAIFQGSDERPAEIVNCWMPGLFVFYNVSVEKLEVRNSVLGPWAFAPQDPGTFAVDVDRCVCLSRETKADNFVVQSLPVNPGLANEKSADLRINARRTVFESSQTMVAGHGSNFVKWAGERNAYRIGGPNGWIAGTACFGLASWRLTPDVREIDSVELDSMLWNSAAWQFGPNSPARSGPRAFGANASRVASPPTALKKAIGVGER